MCAFNDLFLDCRTRHLSLILIVSEGFNGNYVKWREGCTFFEAPYEEDFEHEDSHPEQRAPDQPGTEAVEPSTLKGLWGFGKKDISDDHHGLNTSEGHSPIFQGPGKSLDVCMTLRSSGRGP